MRGIDSFAAGDRGWRKWIAPGTIVAGCFLLLAPRARAEVWTFDIDQTQSQAVITFLGGDHTGAMDGTFYFVDSPGLVDGAYAVIVDLDATVADISLGIFGSLQDNSVVSDPDLDPDGKIVNPDGGPIAVLDQRLPLIIHAVYHPLVGSPETIDQAVELCLGDLDFCGETPGGSASLETATPRIEASGESVIPADQNPLGVDITVNLTLVADGVPGAAASLPVSTSFPTTDERIAVWPNPSAGTVFFRLDPPAAGPVILEVLDVAGRRLATLESSRTLGGRAVLSWNGRDDRGRPAPAGLYLVRGGHGPIRQEGRFLLVR